MNCHQCQTPAGSRATLDSYNSPPEFHSSACRATTGCEPAPSTHGWDRTFSLAMSQLRVAWGAPAPHANNMEYPLPVHSAPASCANPSNSSDSASLTRGPAPSTRGVRHSPLDRVKVVLVFQSTRPRGARRQTMLFVLKRFRFQSTRPRGARLDAVLRLSDQFKFQSTRPRGARPVNDNVILAFELFQSTRPRGARLRSPA